MQNFPSNKHCIRNVAAHEFGHWLGLAHVPSTGCYPYAPYTMHVANPPSPNTHYQEDLACEDKWCAWHTYNVLPAPAPPLLTEPEVMALSDNPVDPEQTRLLQNYPDPFNPDTWMPYELKEDSDVVLEIHDSQGHLIRKFVLGRKSTGRYLDQKRAAYWDGRNEKGESVPSGVYFYTLKAKDFSAIRKMVLLK